MKDLFHISQSELAELGIVAWGYTDVMTPESYERFERWLPQNSESLPFLATEKNVHYRSNVAAWWPEAKSALVFLFSYAPTKKFLIEKNSYRVAGYTLGFEGEDYHIVMKARLHKIADRLKEKLDFNFRHTHDAEAVLERDLAYRAGLGWFGKNSMLISREQGSYFMIGSLIFDRPLALSRTSFSPDHCGTCRACADACPTQAIDLETRTLIAKDCLSTSTIEARKVETPAPKGSESGREELFGCDICQDVCPWNQKLMQSTLPKFSSKAQQWLNWFERDLGEIAVQVAWVTNRAFLRLMEGTPFGRPGRQAFLRTVNFWWKKSSEK